MAPPLKLINVNTNVAPKYAGMSENDIWRKMNYDSERPEPPDLPGHPKPLKQPIEALPISSAIAELVQRGKISGNPTQASPATRLNGLDTIDELYKGIPVNSPMRSDFTSLQQALLNRK